MVEEPEVDRMVELQNEMSVMRKCANLLHKLKPEQAQRVAEWLLTTFRTDESNANSEEEDRG